MGEQRANGEARLAAGLGWFSIGLGLAEMAAPGKVARVVGVHADLDATKMLRAYGARKVANGIAILASGGDDSRWLWARAAGDVLDLVTLGRALTRADSQPGKVAFGLASVGGVLVADVIAARKLGRRGNVIGFRPRMRESRAVRVSKTFTINRPPDEVYDFWRRLDNLPRFMKHLDAVELRDDRRSHWRARGPSGLTLEWDAEITEDTPEWIAWQSLEGATVHSTGSVSFRPAPGRRGTELHVQLEYTQRGKGASLLHKLFGRDAERQLYDDLRRVKQLLETGEISTSRGSTSVSRPAQSPTDAERQFVGGGRR
jgi:uncharacterized membrane protein